MFIPKQDTNRFVKSASTTLTLLSNQVLKGASQWRGDGDGLLILVYEPQRSSTKIKELFFSESTCIAYSRPMPK